MPDADADFASLRFLFSLIDFLARRRDTPFAFITLQARC